MLFPRTDRWRCQLQRHHIQLYLGDRLQEQQGLQPDMLLAEQLDHLLSRYIAAYLSQIALALSLISLI